MKTIRLIQWRELGDDDDTLTVRVILPDDKTDDGDWLRQVYDLEELEFEEGGITITSTIDICDGDPVTDDKGNTVVVRLEAPNV